MEVVALHHQQQGSSTHREIVELLPPSLLHSPLVAVAAAEALSRSGSAAPLLHRNPSRTYYDAPRINNQESEEEEKKGAEDGCLEKNIDLGSKGVTDSVPAVPSKLPLLLGSVELSSSGVWKSALVEFAGSIVLTFISIAAVIGCLKANFTFPRVGVAVTQFVIYTTCVLATVPLSGGHLNPSFSFATMLTGHTSVVRSALYILGQSAGSVVGACIVKQVISKDLSQKYYLGGCLLKQGVEGAQVEAGLVAEISFTFLLIFVAFPAFLEYSSMPRGREELPTRGVILVGVLLGLLIFVSGEIMAPGYTSAGMNPARCFGPAVMQGGKALWYPQWVFWFGPLIASALFALLHQVLHWPANKELRATVEDDAPQQRPWGVDAESSTNVKRLDVFLHIKAMMQNAEDSRETTVLLDDDHCSRNNIGHGYTPKGALENITLA